MIAGPSLNSATDELKQRQKNITQAHTHTHTHTHSKYEYFALMRGHSLITGAFPYVSVPVLKTVCVSTCKDQDSKEASKYSTDIDALLA